MATRFVDGSPVPRAIVACSCQAPPSFAQSPVAGPETVRAGWPPILVHLPGTTARVRPGMPSVIQLISTPPGDNLDSGDPQEMLVADAFLVTVHGACNGSALKKVSRSVKDDVSCTGTNATAGDDETTAGPPGTQPRPYVRRLARYSARSARCSLSSTVQRMPQAPTGRPPRPGAEFRTWPYHLDVRCQPPVPAQPPPGRARMRLSNKLSNDPIGREGMPVDAGGRLRQDQAPDAAGWRGTDLASGRRGHRSLQSTPG